MMEESVGIEPTRPLSRSQFSKLLAYHSPQLSVFFTPRRANILLFSPYFGKGIQTVPLTS